MGVTVEAVMSGKMKRDRRTEENPLILLSPFSSAGAMTENFSYSSEHFFPAG